MFINIESFQQLENILSEDKLVLIEFTAIGCSQCKMMAPIISQIENQFGNSLNVILIDADKNSEIIKRYGILSLPTFLLIKNNLTIETFQMRTKTYISTIIENNL